MVKITKINWLAVESGSINSIDIHPDNSRVAFSQENRVHILGLPEIKEIVDNERKYNLTFNKDQYSFAGSHFDYSNAQIQCIKGSKGTVNVIRFSKDGEFLAVGGDGGVTIYQLKFKNKDEDDLDEFLEEENKLGDESDDGIEWDTNTGFEDSGNKEEKWELFKMLNDVQEVVVAMTFTTKYLIVSYINNKVLFYQLFDDDNSISSRTRQNVFSLDDTSSKFFKLTQTLTTENIVKGISIDPVEMLLFGEGDKHMSLIDLAKKPFRIINTIPKDSVHKAISVKNSFSPCGQYIIGTSCSKDNCEVVPFLSRNPFTTKHFFKGHKGGVIISSFNPSLFKIEKKDLANDDASKNKNEELKPKKKKKKRFLRGMNSKKHENKCYFLTVSNDDQIVLWNNLQVHPILVLYKICSDNVTDVVWSQDGYSCFLTSKDGTIIILSFSRTELGEKVENLKKILTEKYGQTLKILEYPPFTTEKFFERTLQKGRKLKISRKRKIARNGKNEFGSFTDSEKQVLFKNKCKRFKTDTFGEVEFKYEENSKTLYFLGKKSKISIGTNKSREESKGKKLKIYFEEEPKSIITNEQYFVVVTEHGRLHFISKSGIKVSPSTGICLNEKTILKQHINARNQFCCLLKNLDLLVFDVERKKRILETNILSLKKIVNKRSLNENFVDSLMVLNNTPLLTLYNSENYIFDKNWQSWTKITSNYFSEDISFAKETKLKQINDLELNMQISRNLGNSVNYLKFMKNYVALLTEPQNEMKLRDFLYSLLKEKEKICGVNPRQVLEIALQNVNNNNLRIKHEIMLLKNK